METRIRSGSILVINKSKPSKAPEGYHLWVSLFLLVLCPVGGYLGYDAPGALTVYYCM